MDVVGNSSGCLAAAAAAAAATRAAAAAASAAAVEALVVAEATVDPVVSAGVAIVGFNQVMLCSGTGCTEPARRKETIFSAT